MLKELMHEVIRETEDTLALCKKKERVRKSFCKSLGLMVSLASMKSFIEEFHGGPEGLKLFAPRRGWTGSMVVASSEYTLHLVLGDDTKPIHLDITIGREIFANRICSFHVHDGRDDDDDDERSETKGGGGSWYSDFDEFMGDYCMVCSCAESRNHYNDMCDVEGAAEDKCLALCMALDPRLGGRSGVRDLGYDNLEIICRMAKKDDGWIRKFLRRARREFMFDSLS